MYSISMFQDTHIFLVLNNYSVLINNVTYLPPISKIRRYNFLIYFVCLSEAINIITDIINQMYR